MLEESVQTRRMARTLRIRMPAIYGTEHANVPGNSGSDFRGDHHARQKLHGALMTTLERDRSRSPGAYMARDWGKAAGSKIRGILDSE
jgi:hypothetical protein